MRPTHGWAETEEISHTAESIHQETLSKRAASVSSRRSPTQSNSISDSARQRDEYQSLGNKPTTISREPGGSFTLFGGHIVGRQIELVHDERIVQVGGLSIGPPASTPLRSSKWSNRRRGQSLSLIIRAFPRPRKALSGGLEVSLLGAAGEIPYGRLELIFAFSR